MHTFIMVFLISDRISIEPIRKVAINLKKPLRNSIFLIGKKYYPMAIKSEEEVVMATVLNYQLSIFGKYSVEPSVEIITALMPMLKEKSGKDFLPYIINSNQIAFPSNRISNISNLGFTTQDQRFNIAILNERIDVNYNKMNELDLSLDDFCAFSTEILSTIMEYFSFMSSRLAFNTRQFCDLPSFEALAEKGKELVKCIPYYNEKSLSEWSMRTNAQLEIQIKEMKEGINVITSSMQDVTDRRSAVVFLIDINTLPQNMGMRFGKDTLALFVQKISPVIGEITSDVERLITGE